MAWSSPIEPGSSTLNWADIFCPSDSPGPSGDQDPGDPEGDAIRAALSASFEDGGTQIDAANGSVAFRMRASGDGTSAVLESFLAIGLDTREDAHADLDLYLGIDGRHASSGFAVSERVAQVTTLPDYRANDEGMGFPAVLGPDDPPNARGSSARLDWSHAVPSNAHGVISTPIPDQTGAAARAVGTRRR